MTRLSELEGRRLRDATGRELGHLWDLRTTPRDDDADDDGRAVAWLLVGRRGLLERLGFKREAPRRVACEHVRELGRHDVVVREEDLHATPGGAR
jgi:hypothetical protein